MDLKYINNLLISKLYLSYGINLKKNTIPLCKFEIFHCFHYLVELIKDDRMNEKIILVELFKQILKILCFKLFLYAKIYNIKT